MALVVEDGSGVAGAESYASAAQASAYLLARGFATPAGGYEPLLLRAMDVLATRAWRGERASAGQALDFPRVGVPNRTGGYYAEDEIPADLVTGLILLAHHIGEGQDPGVVAEPAIRREVVDVIETEYAVPLGTTTRLELSAIPSVWSRLEPLVEPLAGGMFLA